MAAESKAEYFVDNKRKEDIRSVNINAGRAVSDAVRTSLGPKGMDKMIPTANDEVLITDDGATLLRKMEVLQAAARMMVELTESQDSADAVINGVLHRVCQSLLAAGIHPTVISDALHKSRPKSVDILTAMAVPVELTDRESLVKSSRNEQ